MREHPTAVRDGRPDRRAVSDWTLDRLNEMVFTGELRPGDVLSEVDLTARLQVSRSPIREALRELENAGLLDVDAVNGRRILRAFGTNDVEELYDIRADLEALAARYAARSPTDEFIQSLESLVEDMSRAVGESVEVWLPLDFEFHAAIASGSGARRAPHLLSGLWNQNQALLRRMHLGGSYPSTRKVRTAVLAEHRAVIDAIRDRKPGRAACAARSHIQERKGSILMSLQQSGSTGI